MWEIKYADFLCDLTNFQTNINVKLNCALIKLTEILTKAHKLQL